MKDLFYLKAIKKSEYEIVKEVTPLQLKSAAEGLTPLITGTTALVIIKEGSPGMVWIKKIPHQSWDDEEIIGVVTPCDKFLVAELVEKALRSEFSSGVSAGKDC